MTTVPLFPPVPNTFVFLVKCLIVGRLMPLLTFTLYQVCEDKLGVTFVLLGTEK